MRIRITNPVLLIATLSIAMVIAVVLIDIKLIRIVLGFPFLLFVPGYLTTAAVFPRKGDLGPLERLVLTFGLSITVVPMLCYTLNKTSRGITLYPMLALITVYITVISLLALNRRKDIPKEKRLEWDLDCELNFNWRERNKSGGVIHTGLLLAVLFCLAAAAYSLSTPMEAEQFTEFFILGSSGLAADYPNSVNVNEDTTVTACIVNNESKKTYYRLEVEIENNTVRAISPINLNPGEAWEKEVNFRAGNPGKNTKVSFYLFRLDEKEQTPYRELHLWIDVKE